MRGMLIDPCLPSDLDWKSCTSLQKVELENNQGLGI